MTRRQGKGKANALKYRFYARAFDDRERQDLDAVDAEDLDGEIAALKVGARRVLELLVQAQRMDETIALLNCLGTAELKIASLLKSKKALSGEGSGLAALDQDLGEVIVQLRMDI